MWKIGGEVTDTLPTLDCGAGFCPQDDSLFRKPLSAALDWIEAIDLG